MSQPPHTEIGRIDLRELIVKAIDAYHIGAYHTARDNIMLVLPQLIPHDKRDRRTKLINDPELIRWGRLVRLLRLKVAVASRAPMTKQYKLMQAVLDHPQATKPDKRRAWIIFCIQHRGNDWDDANNPLKQFS